MGIGGNTCGELSGVAPQEVQIGREGGGYPAPRLHGMAEDWLAAHYPGALIVHELSIGAWGAALLDVAAITQTEIIGVEIKGDGDSPTRMTLQAAVYSKAATRMFLLPAPSLQARCFKHVPDCWGRLVVDGAAIVRVSRYNGRFPGYAPDLEIEPTRLCTAPGQLMQALWRDEIIHLARCFRVEFGRKMTREQMTEVIAENVPLRDIRAGVCTALRERKWIRKNLRWSPDDATEAA